jgi:hypothetical protein
MWDVEICLSLFANQFFQTSFKIYKSNFSSLKLEKNLPHFVIVPFANDDVMLLFVLPISYLAHSQSFKSIYNFFSRFAADAACRHTSSLSRMCMKRKWKILKKSIKGFSHFFQGKLPIFHQNQNFSMKGRLRSILEQIEFLPHSKSIFIRNFAHNDTRKWQEFSSTAENRVEHNSKFT